MARKKKNNIMKAFDAALPVAVLVLFALIGYLLFLSPQKERKTETPPVPAPGHVSVEKARPGPAAPEPSPSPAAKTPPAPKSEPAYKARVAIVIDDLGSDLAAIEGVLGIDAPLSVAVLPGLPYSEKSALAAASAGRDVLLHLPMQPKGESMKGLGPGALMKDMDGTSMADIITADLSSVPGAVGVNNHMGSCLTEDRQSMSFVMDTIGSKGLFFLDSRTSSGSVALSAARERGIPSASRNVFLDDTDDEGEIRRQFGRMVGLALKNGEAIAIGHPRSATLKVLREEIPELKQKGIEVVRISMLVR